MENVIDCKHTFFFKLGFFLISFFAATIQFAPKMGNKLSLPTCSSEWMFSTEMKSLSSNANDMADGISITHIDVFITKKSQFMHYIKLKQVSET